MSSFLAAETPQEIIGAGRPLVEIIFIKHAAGEYILNVCDDRS
jgi:hypothetical protein